MQNLHIEHPEDLILDGNLEVFDALYSTAHIVTSCMNKSCSLICVLTSVYTVDDCENAEHSTNNVAHMWLI